jgi:hypothetical protein
MGADLDPVLEGQPDGFFYVMGIAPVVATGNITGADVGKYRLVIPDLEAAIAFAHIAVEVNAVFGHLGKVFASRIPENRDFFGLFTFINSFSVQVKKAGRSGNYHCAGGGEYLSSEVYFQKMSKRLRILIYRPGLAPQTIRMTALFNC